MKEKQSKVQPESDIRASQQETSKSGRRTKDSVQGYINQGSEKLNHDQYYGMKNLM